MSHRTEVMAILWDSLLISAKIWLPWQRLLGPCDQKYLLWIGRPLKPYHRTKSLSITVTQVYLSPLSRYLTLNVFFRRSSSKNNSTSGFTDINIPDFQQKQCDHISSDTTTMPSLVKIGGERSTLCVTDRQTDTHTHTHTQTEHSVAR